MRLLNKSLEKQTLIIPPAHKERMWEWMQDIICSFRSEAVAETVVEFAERKRVLDSGTSARPGPYRYSETPYLREIADALSDQSNTIETAVMKPTQWGYTEGVLMNHELYCIEYGIGAVLYVTSDDDLAGEHMEKRVDTMISTAGMSHYIEPPVQKRSNKGTGDTKRSKSYKGTFLRAIGARSESKLSSIPIRILHLDEEDKYPGKLSGGGDPIDKAKRRTDSFNNLKKIAHGSTPKEKATSKIEPVFQAGDMRYYNIKCPECGTYQKLAWNQIEWDKNDDGKIDLHYDDEGNLLNNPVWHNCSNSECDFKMKDYQKVELLKEEGYGGAAKWIPTKKPDRPGLKSWKGHGLEGFRSWVDIVVQWDQIEGDIIKLQDMINDVFGETFEQKIDKPDEHYLASRAESDWIRGDVNERVKVLYLGADVQKDRVECGIWGYADKKESWAIDYHVFPGNPNDPNDECWDKLYEVISKEYIRADGKSMWIQIAMIDSPYERDSVHNFCQRFPYQQNSLMGVFPCFGRQTPAKIVSQFESAAGTPAIQMDDQKLKFELYSSLKRKAPAVGGNYPAGYMHFPMDYHEDYYKQLTAEDVTETVDAKGIKKYMISNVKQRRNEVLDCCKIALAGLYYTYTQYFKVWNGARKKKKQKEISPDWSLFWSIFGDDQEKENES